jgi:hypothetical protein
MTLLVERHISDMNELNQIFAAPPQVPLVSLEPALPRSTEALSVATIEPVPLEAVTIEALPAEAGTQLAQSAQPANTTPADVHEPTSVTSTRADPSRKKAHTPKNRHKETKDVPPEKSDKTAAMEILVPSPRASSELASSNLHVSSMDIVELHGVSKALRTAPVVAPLPIVTTDEAIEFSRLARQVCRHVYGLKPTQPLMTSPSWSYSSLISNVNIFEIAQLGR